LTLDITDNNSNCVDWRIKLIVGTNASLRQQNIHSVQNKTKRNRII